MIFDALAQRLKHWFVAIAQAIAAAIPAHDKHFNWP